MTNLGSYHEQDGLPAVRLRRHYPRAIDRVWAAATTPDELAHRFPSWANHDATCGGEIRFIGDPGVGDVTGTVPAFDPPHHFAFTWGQNGVHLRLGPDGPGACVLAPVGTSAWTN